MGKPTGFMEFSRQSEGYEPAETRVKHFREFVARLSDEQATIQGARCMDCGIPFCNNGCPVNNVIPDWNDLVYRGQWQQALDREMKTVATEKSRGSRAPDNSHPSVRPAIFPASREALSRSKARFEPARVPGTFSGKLRRSMPYSNHRRCEGKQCR